MQGVWVRRIRKAMRSLIVMLTSVVAGAQIPPPGSTDLYIEINVPAFRLDVLENGVRIRSYEIAVGLPRYTTPQGQFQIDMIVWNPWWYPPDSWWARKEKVTPPGPSNPMGKVKLSLGGSLYVHATPFEASIGTAASHACVRMRARDAVELATLVQTAGRADISAESMSSLIDSWDPTRTVWLSSPVPVSIAYRLAEITADTLLLHPNVYRVKDVGMESQALNTMAAAGIDSSRVDRNVLRSLILEARSKNVKAALSRLIRN